MSARVDVHAHAFPAAFLRELARLYPDEFSIAKASRTLIALWNNAPLPAFDVRARIEAMDRDGVALEVLSAPPLYARFDQHSARLCREMNDFQLALAREYPDRFRAFIHVPCLDPDATREELARLRTEPLCAGVVIGSNMQGVYPGQEPLRYLWPLLCSAQLPLFIHPVAPCAPFGPIAPPVLQFPNDTAIAAASLIYAGVLEAEPGLRVILPHYGGTLPMLQSRLDMLLHPHFAPLPGKALPLRPSAYVPRFYVDTAQGFHAPSFACARDVFGTAHMLYGSDYFLLDTPWRGELNAFLDRALPDPAERAAVLHENARGLLLLDRTRAMDSASRVAAAEGRDAGV